MRMKYSPPRQTGISHLLVRMARDDAGFDGSLPGRSAIVLMRGGRQRVTPEIGASPLNRDVTYRMLDGVWQSSKRRLSSRRSVRGGDLPLEPTDSRIRLVRLLEVRPGFRRREVTSEIRYLESRSKQKADAKGCACKPIEHGRTIEVAHQSLPLSVHQHEDSNIRAA